MTDYEHDGEPLDECDGTVLCDKCGRLHGICNEVQFQLTGAKECDSDLTNPGMTPEEWREDNNMIPRSNGNSGTVKGKKPAGLKYLSTGMLSSAHQTATIVDARIEPDNFGADKPDVVVVKLK